MTTNKKQEIHETGIFVGIGLKGVGNEALGQVHTMFGVFPDWMFVDAEGNYVSPYDEHGKRIPEEKLLEKEGVVKKFVELRLGEEIPLPCYNPEFMKKVYRGKFAVASAQERILKEYESGKTPHEVYAGLLKDGLIILDPNREIPQEPTPVSEILENHHETNVTKETNRVKKRGG